MLFFLLVSPLLSPSAHAASQSSAEGLSSLSKLTQEEFSNILKPAPITISPEPLAAPKPRAREPDADINKITQDGFAQLLKTNEKTTAEPLLQKPVVEEIKPPLPMPEIKAPAQTAKAPPLVFGVSPSPPPQTKTVEQGLNNKEILPTKNLSAPVPIRSNIPVVALVSKDTDGTYIRNLGRAGSKIPLDLEASSVSRADVMEPVRLEEAVAFALKNNFEVQASGARVDSARWDKYGAYSQYLPSVDISTAHGTERSRPGSYNDADGNRVMDSTHARTDRAISIRQPLVDLSIIADVLKGHSRENLSESDQLDVREDVAYKTVTAFFKLVQARKTVQLADRYKNYLDDLYDRMQIRVEGGGATNADLERIRSRSTLAQASRLEAVGAYGSGLSEFRRLTKITPALLEIPDRLSPDTPPTAQEALVVALKANPAYLSSLYKIDVAAGDRDRSLGNLLPKLSAEFSKVYTRNAGGVEEGNPVDGIYPIQNDRRFMLVARWTLAGGTSVASGLSGAAKVRQMSFLSQDVKARIEEAVFMGYDALEAANKRISILQETLEADSNVVKDFEEQYKQGSRSLFDLLDAYERLHNSQLELMRTMIAKAQVAYQIRRQTGDLAAAVLGNKERKNGIQ